MALQMNWTVSGTSLVIENSYIQCDIKYYSPNSGVIICAKVFSSESDRQNNNRPVETLTLKTNSTLVPVFNIENLSAENGNIIRSAYLFLKEYHDDNYDFRGASDV